MNKKKTVLLMILDGFGINKDKKYNGILNSNMKNYFKLWDEFPHTKIHASGPLVGLPKGQIGSSEVGHLTLGGGRLIKQPIVRINEEIKSGEFIKNKKLNSSLKHIKTKGNIHIMGLLGDGGVHSSQKHLYGFLDFYDENISKFKGDIFIHNFLDGRDTAQQSAIKFLDELDKKIKSLKNKNRFHLASLCGRFYSMDRDKRWERVEVAYNLIVNSVGDKFENYTKAVKESYKNKIYDEFLKPVILENFKPMSNDDLCVFYNFRSDRPKEIIKAFLNYKYVDFKTKKFKNLKIQTLTKYLEESELEVLYPTIFPKNTCGEIISKNKLTQLRISESEKFPHITYFFNGLNYEVFHGEDRIKIASPKVETYDLKPEMNCLEVGTKVVSHLLSGKYDFILLNFANPDMVGHTGNYKAVVSSLKALDIQIKNIKEAIDKIDGTLIITADHGNCEVMKDENNKPHTKHTYNQVPFIICDKSLKLKQNSSKLSLYHVAPTVLELLNIKIPKEMSESLIKK